MKGFSLLEIMVTVAIVSIMASSVIIGFGAFEKTVRMRETAGVINDIIKNLELDMIRRDYTKQTVHFEENFLVSEAEPETQTLSLEYIGPGCTADGAKKIKATNAFGQPIYLAQRDAEGNNLNISVISTGDSTTCVDFLNSKENEWTYQLFKGSEVSQTIRFLHFNLRRDDNLSTWATIADGNQYTLEITAPYADKAFYKNGVLTTDSVTLTLKNDDNQETVTLQE